MVNCTKCNSDHTANGARVGFGFCYDCGKSFKLPVKMKRKPHIVIKLTTSKLYDVIRDGEKIVEAITLRTAKDSYEYDEIVSSTTADQLKGTNDMLIEAVELLRRNHKGKCSELAQIFKDREVFLKRFDK